MAFVVQMIFRIAGSKAGNGITSFEALRQAGAMDAFPCPLFFERVQHRGRLIRRCRGVDFTQSGGQGLAVLPGADVQRMADQVDDAGLDGRLRESGGDRLGEALQPQLRQFPGDFAGLAVGLTGKVNGLAGQDCLAWRNLVVARQYCFSHCR